MNKDQIAFIICTDHVQYYNECVRYIQELEIPDGFTVDTVCIPDADSMAQGYNAGMQKSKAQYKVYLHPDTFILNRRFLYDILHIFQKNDTIGMIGVLGGNGLPSDADCRSDWNVGKIEFYNGRTVTDCNFIQPEGEEYLPVEAIDGLIMATQYDIPWREDFLDGWDFYDVSQSLEMRMRGYQVVVPYQKIPWCYHDCGASKRKSYDSYRAKIIQEYPQVFQGDVDQNKAQERQQEISDAEQLKKRMLFLAEEKQYDELEKITRAIHRTWPADTAVCEIINMMEIYSLEKSSIYDGHSQWLEQEGWEQIAEYYLWVRLVLLRIGYERPDERAEKLKNMIENGIISRDAIRKISNNILKNTSNVYKYLLKKEGEEPLVSVVVAVYNGEAVLRETLDSILQQTYCNLEVIVIDDASSDCSRDIISSYKDPRIKTIFLEKNHNVCNAGNIGFQQASGKYIGIIGHDDVWRPDKLEKQISFLEEHPSYSVCFTWADIIDEEGKVINKCRKEWEYLDQIFCGDNLDQDQWIRMMTKYSNYFCASSACIRRECVEKTGYYRYGLVQLQDYDLWLRLLCEGPVYILQEKLTNYRRFIREEKNLSTMNAETMNRYFHEKQWIQDTFIEKLPSEQFVRIFKEDLKNQDARTEKEILCEKVFFLWEAGNCLAEKRFIELLEDEECRRILEEKYQFELNDFYEENKKPMLFDYYYYKAAEKN